MPIWSVILIFWQWLAYSDHGFCKISDMESFFVACTSRPATLIKRRIHRMYFPMNFPKSFKTALLLKTWQQLLLLRTTFFYHGFLSHTLMIHRTAGEGSAASLFLSTTSTRSRTFRHLFATLHVRWLPRFCNRIVCNNQSATRWNLPPWLLTIYFVVLKNGQTYFKNLAVWTPQDFQSMFGHFSTLWNKGLIKRLFQFLRDDIMLDLIAITLHKKLVTFTEEIIN